MRFLWIKIIFFIMLLLNNAYADIILQKLNVEKSSEYKELRSRYSTPSPVVEADFYPLGWSKDSKFAYILVPAPQASSSAVFRIQDMITDKILFEKRYREGSDGYPIDLPIDLKKLTRNKGEVAHYLNKYRIKGYNDKLHWFPIKHPKKGIDYNLKTVHEINPYFWHQQFLSRVNVDLYLYSITVDGQKKIATKTILDKKVDLQSLQYSTMVVGYLKSPFEERIAIVMIYFGRGWEGPPHATSFELVGASLSKGF